MFKLELEKAEEPEIKLPTSAGSSKKQESSIKTSISALLTMPKPLCRCLFPPGMFFLLSKDYCLTFFMVCDDIFLTSLCLNNSLFCFHL